jgi:Ran GTPase-activating protein (RanGAP) involved in mRNA processing and transport
MLLVNQSLKKLELLYNKISEDMAISIAESLKVNKTLNQLALGTDFPERSFNNNDRSSLVFAEMLLVNNSLESLNLMYNGFSPRGVKSIVSALQQNTAVWKLRISLPFQQIRRNENLPDSDVASLEGCNDVTEATSAIVDLLRVSKTLGDLEIPFPTNVESMCIALNSNNTLRKLTLLNNNIGDHESSFISEMLKINKTLVSLDLWGNHMSPAGAVELLLALRWNETLTCLDIVGCIIDERVFSTVLEILNDWNDTMEKLELFSWQNLRNDREISKKNQIVKCILSENRERSRIAPKKVEYRRHIIYDWLLLFWKK